MSDSLPKWQRRCVLPRNKFYIKQTLTSHNGCLFGKAVYQPRNLAETVNLLTVKCLYGFPEFYRSAAWHQSPPFVDTVNNHPGKQRLTLLLTGIKQMFVWKLNPVQGKSFMNRYSSFLSDGYVYVMKCIRNNWLIDKIGQLVLSLKEGSTSQMDWLTWSDVTTRWWIKALGETFQID